MKFSKTLTGLCIALALCCSACKDKLFDFNLNNIEANGEWGIPVFNGSISVEDLFQHLDSTNIIQIGSDGSLKFIFEHDMENAVLLKDVVKFEDQHIDTSGVETVTHLPDFDFSQIIQFSLNNEDFVLKSCHVKSGLLTINFNINNGSFAYTADLTTDQILDANDNPVTLHFSSTQQQQVINLSEYSIWPTFSGDIQFHTHMVIPSVTGLEQVSYECHISLQNFDIHDVVCQFKAISNEFDAKNELSFDFDKLQFNNFQLNNAVASVFARNSICTIDGSIDQLTQTPMSPFSDDSTTGLPPWTQENTHFPTATAIFKASVPMDGSCPRPTTSLSYTTTLSSSYVPPIIGYTILAPMRVASPHSPQATTMPCCTATPAC